MAKYERKSFIDRYLEKYYKARESQIKQGRDMYDTKPYTEEELNSLYEAERASGSVKNRSEFIIKAVREQTYAQPAKQAKSEREFLAEHEIQAKSRDLRSIESKEFAEQYADLLDEEYWKKRQEGLSAYDTKDWISQYVFGSD